MKKFDFSKCPGYCERARRIMVEETHPLFAKKQEEIKPSMIPIQDALGQYMEDEKILSEMLASTQNKIKILRGMV